jgi:hypothetical protein
MNIVYAQWIIMTRTPVSVELSDKTLQCIKDNPEAFPWHTKFYNCPPELYQKFLRECYYAEKGWFSEIEPPSSDDCGWASLVSTPIDLSNIKREPITKEHAYQQLMEIYDSIQEHNKANKTEADRVKKIWDKYYAEYDLECNEDAYNAYYRKYQLC